MPQLPLFQLRVYVNADGTTEPLVRRLANWSVGETLTRASWNDNIRSNLGVPSHKAQVCQYCGRDRTGENPNDGCKGCAGTGVKG